MQVLSSYHGPAGALGVSFDRASRMVKRRRKDEGEDLDSSSEQQQRHHLVTSSRRDEDAYFGAEFAAASSYPEVSSQPQPYFYHHQPPPHNYNSAWLPKEAPLHPVPSNYTLPSHTMPLFPPRPPAEQNNVSGFSTCAPLNLHDADDQLPYNCLSVPPRHVQVHQPSSTLGFDDAGMHLKIQSLSTLDQLATQLIGAIANASFPEIRDLMHGNDTEGSQAYITLKNLFDQTRKVYSREMPFIDAIAIQIFHPAQQEIIRKANIATFVSSILGAHDVSFYHLNEFFIETFVPLGHRLLKWQGSIYLELKTQAYISALLNSDGTPGAMLDELFPSDLDAQILTRHPDTPSLSPSEQDFIDRSRARKNYLLAEPTTEQALQELPNKYHWNDFVREFALGINKNADSIMNVPIRLQTHVGGTNPTDRRNSETIESARAAGSWQQAIAGTGPAGTAAAGHTSNGVLTASQQHMSAVTQANQTSRKAAGSSSTVRQPWSKTEEDALLTGLERVNGPHWSQILALYGRGGSVSEVLKDRNQVQLKDKARNLKLWYLKMGKEVPLVLREVTGELRKRGGAKVRAAMYVSADEAEQDMGDAEEDDEGRPTLETGGRPGRSNRRGKKK